MADVNKTLADISEELRRMAEAQYEAWANDPNDAPDGRYWASFLCKLADRIDAAAKRETVTDCHGLGNVVKMREALLRCDAIAQLPETRELQSIKDMRNIISAALAAPPRNCDLFDDDDDAFSAWHHALKDGDVVCVQNAFRWLFALLRKEAKYATSLRS